PALMRSHHAGRRLLPKTDNRRHLETARLTGSALRGSCSGGKKPMPTNDLTIAMVGSGGDGVVTMGNLIAQAAAREGLHVIQTEAYGPQIRGGEASCTVRVAAGESF